MPRRRRPYNSGISERLTFGSLSTSIPIRSYGARLFVLCLSIYLPPFSYLLVYNLRSVVFIPRYARPHHH